MIALQLMSPGKLPRACVLLVQHRGRLFQHLGKQGLHESRPLHHKLKFLEPIGSSIPKLVGDTKINLVTKRSSDVISLACPAQGMPIPSFRCVSLNLQFNDLTQLCPPL